MSDVNLPPTNCPMPTTTGDPETDAPLMAAYLDCRLREGMAILGERWLEAETALLIDGYPHDPANPKTANEIYDEMAAAVRAGTPFPPKPAPTIHIANRRDRRRADARARGGTR